jgi:hypothetical protein
MSFAQLLAIVKDSRHTKRDEVNRPPVACPVDGELLDVHPDGRRNCPLGNYRWPR